MGLDSPDVILGLCVLNTHSIKVHLIETIYIQISKRTMFYEV